MTKILKKFRLFIISHFIWLSLTIFSVGLFINTYGVELLTISKTDGAFLKENRDGVMASMSLKRQKAKFNQLDISNCAKNIKRVKGSLRYYCQISFLPVNATAQFKSLHGGNKLKLPFGQAEKVVFIHISPDAKYIKFVVEYDTTSIDLDFMKFNPDFFNSYSTLSLKLFTEIMIKKPLIVDLYSAKPASLANN